jgi:hypothetical protein
MLRRCGTELNIGERLDRNVLMWYGHVEKMEDESLYGNGEGR